MFSVDVVDSDTFLDMPISAQALYFHLGMRADDEGFISPQKILRMTNTTIDDLKVLMAKKFVIPFDSGVIVIRHWKLNNYLQKDRITETLYQQEKAQLCYDKNNLYQLKSLENQDVIKMDTKCIQDVSKMYPQYSIDQYSIDNNIYILSNHEKNDNNNNEKNLSINRILPKSNQKIVFNETTNEFENITDDYWNKWYEVFPALDVQAEIDKAAAWVMANPTRKKKDWARFLNNWLARAQDRAEIRKSRIDAAYGGKA